uniref:uncharacterized protein LOC109952150 isoform X3 n=1 Tax=Monopterus albus TaxID=43700 RepID=UPI0009B3A984|nr:uncharacterized protein LOC109952150 isoform X3 [Monopterus albus]
MICLCFVTVFSLPPFATSLLLARSCLQPSCLESYPHMELFTSGPSPFCHQTIIHQPGFAVNLQVILANPQAQFKRSGSQPGMQESDFLKQITKVPELEPKANNCTRVHRVFASHISAL